MFTSNPGTRGRSLLWAPAILLLLALPIACSSGSSATTAPFLNAPLADQHAVDGQKATFTIAVSGSGPFTYQWWKDGAAITGQTGFSYVPIATFADDNAKISVIVSNPYGSTTSNQATLRVVRAPVAITNQPKDASAPVGTTATFTVSASGTAPVYQWYRNGVAISTTTEPSAGTAAYTTPTLAGADDGAKFKVVVSNAVPSTVTSNEVTLSVGSVATQNLLKDSGFEDGLAQTAWTLSGAPGDLIADSSFSSRLGIDQGTWVGFLGAWTASGGTQDQFIYQDVAIPANAITASLTFDLSIFDRGTPNTLRDTLAVEIRNPSTNALIATLVTKSNADNPSTTYPAPYTKIGPFNLNAYAGQTIRIYFNNHNGIQGQRTYFGIDETAVAVTVPAITTAQVLGNPGFEDGLSQTAWTLSGAAADQIADSSFSSRLGIDAGTYVGFLGAWTASGGTQDQFFYQDVAIPANALTADFSFDLSIFDRGTPATVRDTLAVEIRNPATNAVLGTLVTRSNADNPSTTYPAPYAKVGPFDLLAYKGQTVRIYFNNHNGVQGQRTYFGVDETNLTISHP